RRPISCPQSQGGGIPQRQFLIRPPTRSRASSTITERPAAAILFAALRPARPAPTTTTSARFGRPLGGWARVAALLPGGSAANPPSPTVPTAPAAAPPTKRRRVRRDSVLS